MIYADLNYALDKNDKPFLSITWPGCFPQHLTAGIQKNMQYVGAMDIFAQATLENETAGTQCQWRFGR